MKQRTITTASILATLLLLGAAPAGAGGCCVQGACVDAMDETACTNLSGTRFYPDGDCPASGFNGYCPEPTPRAGEQRLNRFQYIGSHNAFQRRADATSAWYTLADQVDKFGMVNLELDVWWECTADSGAACESDACYFEVQHNCGDSENDDPLCSFLQDLSQSEAISRGFVQIDFDIHVGDASDYEASGCFDDMPDDWQDRLKPLITSYLPEASIYTPQEFINIDGARWPSMQELFRRGKHLVMLCNRGAAGSDFFFDAAESVIEEDEELNEVERRTDNENQVFSLGDRFLSLWFPSGGFGADSDWFTAVGNGFTYPTAYAVDDPERILHGRLHPPMPTYVDIDANGDEQFGTWYRPYAGSLGFATAVFRVLGHEQIHGVSNVDIVIESGEYSLILDPFDSGAPWMTLKARGGPVILTKP